MDLTTVASRRISGATYRRVTSWTVVLVGFIIVTGATVRLTDSGLGCPNWPDCTTGHLVAQAGYHPMVEFLNRVVTALVSIAVIIAALGAFLRQPRRRDLRLLGLGLVAGLVAQIVLGGETVRHRLEPAFVMAHFLLSMLLLWDAVVLHHRASLPDDRSRRPLGDRRLTALSRLLVVMVATTVVAGTVVTGAGPHSGANAGDGRVRRWHLDLHRVTQVHGTAAMLTLALTLACWWVMRARRAHPELRHRLELVLEALAIQISIGYTQYFSGVPAVLVAFHVVGAVLVWTAVLRFALAAGSGGGIEDSVPGRAAGVERRRRAPAPV